MMPRNQTPHRSKTDRSKRRFFEVSDVPGGGMVEILQRSVPHDVTLSRPLPGIAPLGPDDWLAVDEAYGAQMARRIDLLTKQRADVLQLDAAAMPAAQELLNETLDVMRRRPELGFTLAEGQVRCPDGRSVDLKPEDPLGTLGQMVQEDLCILQKSADEHVLTGAVLCFPASWRLSDKFMCPLTDIHVPVTEYDAALARRVQRLFDGVQVGRPLWRYNTLWYQDPELHQPRSASEPRRVGSGQREGPYLRSEKQSVFRLPQTRAVVFSIHTYVLARADVPTANGAA
jgi:hypothetical protein